MSISFLKRPQFWRTINLLSIALYPIGIIYSLISALVSLFIKTKRVPVPVICIGNITIGGTGKTPCVMALCDKLKMLNMKPAIISRGYGSLKSHKNPLCVQQDASPILVGDEALLMSHVAPTYICTNRYKAAMLAVKNGASVIIMDDGMQHKTLHKDCTIMLIDSKYGLGNMLPIPAGPLRESLSNALKRTDAIAITCPGKIYPISLENLEKLCKKKAWIIEINNPGQQLNDKYIALCSIAAPENFLSSLEVLGVEVVKSLVYGDHYIYSKQDIDYIEKMSITYNAPIITTKKDAVKLGALKAKYIILEQEVSLPDTLLSLIINKITNLK